MYLVLPNIDSNEKEWYDIFIYWQLFGWGVSKGLFGSINEFLCSNLSTTSRVQSRCSINYTTIYCFDIFSCSSDNGTRKYWATISLQKLVCSEKYSSAVNISLLEYVFNISCIKVGEIL